METLYFIIFLIIAMFSSTAAGDSSNDCVYTFYVKTGSIIKGGTDANISITMGDPSGRSVWVPNLRSWGLMGPNHDYFERGNIDIFSGRGPCVGAPVCCLNLTSDGSGSHHSWYCDYVQVTTAGPQRRCGQTTFYVDQWLSTVVPPFQLTTVIDGCTRRHGSARQGIKKGRFVVGRPRHRRFDFLE
ncbi:hypothetical protein EZV62_005564 [Acer yangbiense]|uniref:PLAT domain-containing protein n=1 Tax=Acer yangbiense TaxID=1000413 RepID=A0A5C7INH9_9ROSI|nr:hypothetical protein EZV62_005557 [Acer yangbiense]TXG70629.1 hypothetical protein EZV62_005564 [Acer yangbiense]